MVKAMLRITMLTIVTAAGTLALSAAANAVVRPGEGPWCAVYPLGDSAQSDCIYRSVEECRPNVLAGNRGYCSPNPRWPDTPPRQRSHRKRHG